MTWRLSKVRDYTAGALEALSWVQLLLKREEKEEALKEVKDAIETMLKGIAIDFRRRITVSW